MYVIILCGGRGTRLWPLSRTLMPKQFVKLFEDKSLFQMTVQRNKGISNGFIIVTNKEQFYLAKEQLEELSGLEATKNPSFTFLLEPVGKNTAPAIALACFMLDPEEVVLVSPSDHMIKDEEAYRRAVTLASEYAKKGYLVTFGIEPTSPETGYGYIKAKANDSEGKVFEVELFREKPDLETAKGYITANIRPGQSKFFWNSGIFCFKAGVYLEELKRFEPEIYESTFEAYKHKELKRENVFAIKQELMERIPEKSIDHAVMEKSGKIKLIKADFYWSDVGSFDSLYDLLPRDDSGNTLNENAINIETKNNLIISDNNRFISTLGVEDLIIVDTSDSLLVAKKGYGQKVREVVSKVKERRPELLESHVKVFRPWGSYEVLLVGNGYKIKRIVVKPGGKLSLQKHFHRNEHWIVVSGTATVTVGDKKYYVRPNESTYIKMGEVHRLENEGKIDLVLIEVQVGEYTGEDDIERIEDKYAR
ncbi:MAG: mannose-1-phosphate guanylyltransferase/mannose-6-phosphate isomerase [Caldimicrobium sp.]